MPGFVAQQLFGDDPGQMLLGNLSSLTPQTNSNTQLTGVGEGQLLVESEQFIRCTYLDHYYRYFHACHPCALPWRYLQEQYRILAKRKRLEPLIAVMRFIGSLHTASNLSSSLREVAESTINEPQNEAPDGFMVQCHLIYSIAFFWSCELEKSREHIQVAIALALDLGMFRRQFAMKHGEGDVVLEESWRRTWWQLYIVDSWYAAIRHEVVFPTRDVEVSVELPCEEQEYESGTIPTPRTLNGFEDREFAHESHVYSSFVYLIGAARCCVAACTVVPDDVSCWDSSTILTEADAIMESWQLLLPDSKRELVGHDGQVDELMFQAQMLLNTGAKLKSLEVKSASGLTCFGKTPLTSVLLTNLRTVTGLHRPFSALLFNPLESLSTCTTEPPSILPTQDSKASHTTHCLRAITSQIRLIALPIPPLQHTPFTICMINESAIPLLSACKYLFQGQRLSVGRSQVRLMIGYLKKLGMVWRRADKNLGELRDIAREVLAPMVRGQVVSVTKLVDVDVADPWMSEDWGDLAMPDMVDFGDVDAFWAVDGRIEMSNGFEDS